MALKKAIKTQYGVFAEYWNISLIQHNFRDKVLYVKLFGYSDEIVRNEEAQPIIAIDFTFNGDDCPPEITRQAAYEMIKTHADFSDAEDV